MQDKSDKKPSDDTVGVVSKPLGEVSNSMRDVASGLMIQARNVISREVNNAKELRSSARNTLSKTSEQALEATKTFVAPVVAVFKRADGDEGTELRKYVGAVRKSLNAKVYAAQHQLEETKKIADDRLDPVKISLADAQKGLVKMNEFRREHPEVAAASLAIVVGLPSFLIRGKWSAIRNCAVVVGAGAMVCYGTDKWAEQKRNMDTLVDTLQTQRQELLAVHATASDRETTQTTIKELKKVSQELELVASAATPLPRAAILSADFYASYLLLELLCRNLNDARFLWKRIPIEIKEASEELRNVWEIGKALWQRNLAAAYSAMDYDWSPSLQKLIEDLKTSTREHTAELLSRAYSTIPVSDVAIALGFARHEDAIQYCLSLNWSVSEVDQFISPKLLRCRPSKTVDLAQLDMLSKAVLHLEQKTVIKLS